MRLRSRYSGFLLVFGLVLGCDSDQEPSPVAVDTGEEASSQADDEESEPFVPVIQEFAVPAGSRPHDVAPAPDGIVWYTAQRQEALGRLDPLTGETRHIHLGAGAAPHGVIVGPDGIPWITDGGLNAIVSVRPGDRRAADLPAT